MKQLSLKQCMLTSAIASGIIWLSPHLLTYLGVNPLIIWSANIVFAIGFLVFAYFTFGIKETVDSWFTRRWLRKAMDEE